MPRVAVIWFNTQFPADCMRLCTVAAMVWMNDWLAVSAEAVEEAMVDVARADWRIAVVEERASN